MSSILPITTTDKGGSSLWSILQRRLRSRRSRPATLLALLAISVLVVLSIGPLRTLKRDLGYILRPLWDSPERPFDIIQHFPRPGNNNDTWCALHGWAARQGARPMVVDAVSISTELDMLEVRIREYAPFVSLFIVVEADKTFAGTPKPLHFANNRQRFEDIAKAAGSRIRYHQVTGLQYNLPRGSFVNEIKQRLDIGSILEEEHRSGAIPDGSLVIQSDVDEIISRATLELLTTCHGYPSELHLSARNYRYSFNQPLRDEGYWRPRVSTVTEGEIVYHHGRGSDTLLANAGWHCTFCFPTLEDMRAKMLGYSHNDRLKSKSLLKEAALRKRVCSGEDPFDMWAEGFTFRDIISQTGPIRPANDFLDIPVALQEEPHRFPYLLDKGCERPNK